MLACVVRALWRSSWGALRWAVGCNVGSRNQQKTNLLYLPRPPLLLYSSLLLPSPPLPRPSSPPPFSPTSSGFLHFGVLPLLRAERTAYNGNGGGRKGKATRRMPHDGACPRRGAPSRSLRRPFWPCHLLGGAPGPPQEFAPHPWFRQHGIPKNIETGHRPVLGLRCFFEDVSSVGGLTSHKTVR